MSESNVRALPQERPTGLRELLLRARSRDGLRQVDLATQLGVRQQTVASWESRTHPQKPQIRFREPLARFLGLGLPDLELVLSGRYREGREVPDEVEGRPAAVAAERSSDRLDRIGELLAAHYLGEAVLSPTDLATVRSLFEYFSTRRAVAP